MAVWQRGSNCFECDSPMPPYTFGRPRRYCAHSCTRKARRRIERKMVRARALGATLVEPIDPVLVFSRARWRCQGCGIRTPREKRHTFEHDEPTMDHIVSLTKGGQHTMSNVQCLCRRCNQVKGSS